MDITAEKGRSSGGFSRKILIGLLAVSVAANLVQGMGGIRLYRKAAVLESTSESQTAGNSETDGNVQSASAGVTTTEDDVTIDGQYVIRSTTAISDAYQSGDTSALSEKEKETLDMASQVLQEIITEDMTDYEKELAVYQWMCSNLETDEGVMTVVPTTSEGVDEPYGVLKNHKAICVGYATTFRLFMQMMGIDCMVIHSSELMHAWNLVKLDGHWYHTDIYSDVGSGNYMAFNLNDELMQASDEDAESWDTDFFPAADSVEYTCLYQNSETATDVYALAERLRQAMDSGETAVALKYDSVLSDEEKQVISETANQISMYLMTARENIGTETYLSSSVTDVDGGSFVLVNIITYDLEEEDMEMSSLSEEVQTKITAAVSSAFTDYTAGNETTGDDTAGNVTTEDSAEISENSTEQGTLSSTD